GVPAIVFIEIRDERDIVEEAVEQRALVVADLGVLALEVLRRGFELAQVLQPRLRLGSALALEIRPVAALLEHARDRLRRRHARDLVGQDREQLHEALDLRRNARPGLALREALQAVEQRDALQLRLALRRLDGGLADAPRGLVHDAA